MILDIIGDWTFKPEFMGNKDMVLHMHQLSGAEELKCGIGDSRDQGTFLEKMITEIEKPFSIKEGGEQRPVSPGDIANYGALKDLYFEVLVEYSTHTSLDEETVKN